LFNSCLKFFILFLHFLSRFDFLLPGFLFSFPGARLLLK